jgi:hypothetical protein
MEDIVQFFACLLYPMEIIESIQFKDSVRKHKMLRVEDIENSLYLNTQVSSFFSLHTVLYTFTLKQLKSLVNIRYFCIIYANYYSEEIVNGTHVEDKKVMQKNPKIYKQAFGEIFKLCRQKLASWGLEIKGDQAANGL